MASLMIPTKKLPNVILGKDPGFSRAEAMAQLAASDLHDRERLLAQVLEDSSQPRRYRAVAAIALGRIATSASEKILLRNLPKTADDSFPEVLLSLGRIGTAKALAAIGALNLSPQYPAWAKAAYAATLIAHRLRLPGHELPFPANADLLEPPATQMRPIEFTPLEPAIALTVLDAMKRHPYGITFDPAKLTRIQCAGEINIFCPNCEFLGAAAASLRDRKALFALGALQSPETGDYSVSYVFLTRPSPAGTIEIMVHRCSGALALAGTGTVAGLQGEFKLRSVRRPGALAISVKGAMQDWRVRITEAASSTTRERRREPGWLMPQQIHNVRTVSTQRSNKSGRRKINRGSRRQRRAIQNRGSKKARAFSFRQC